MVTFVLIHFRHYHFHLNHHQQNHRTLEFHYCHFHYDCFDPLSHASHWQQLFHKMHLYSTFVQLRRT